MGMTKKCEHCGQDFEPLPSHYTRARCCSPECYKIVARYGRQKDKSEYEVHKNAYIEREEERKKKRGHVETIAQVQQKAEAMGLSYGLYEAYKRLGWI